MRIVIITKTTIDTASGATESKSTWQVEGEEKGLGPAITQAAAALTRSAPPPPSSDYVPDDSPPRDHPATKDARIMGGLLDIREDVEQALTTRPAGRVLEVLRWIKQRRSTTNIRSVSSLFWSLVNKD